MSIKDNLARVRESLNEAALKAGRKTDDVALMAVSKTKPLELIKEAYEAGQRLFGENRVLEAKEKFALMPDDIRLEMIGHLQTNKLNPAVDAFDCIQTLDSVRLAEKLEARCNIRDKCIDVLLQLKTSDEMSKTGLDSFDLLQETAEAVLGMSRLRITGLMTIAPFTDHELTVRKAFSDCREAKERLCQRFPELEMSVLSMGMSSDFEWAIQEGSTQVRIGSAIFGVRS